MSEVYTILAPADATIADVQRLTVETFLDEENPPEFVKIEPLGIDPEGKGVWSVEVGDGPASPQEASGSPNIGSPGDHITPDDPAP